MSIALRPPIEFILKQTGSFRRHLADLTPLWDRFKVVMQKVEEERFDTHGHGDWPPLAESTLREKALLGYPSDPLIRTGDLGDSLTNPGRAAQTTARWMSWGTDIDYAHWHQDGGTIPGRPPQRPVLDIRVDDRRELERAQVSWINDIAARTFGRI